MQAPYNDEIEKEQSPLEDSNTIGSLEFFDLIPPGPPERSQEFATDPNPNKIDLRVGTYKNEQGITPKLDVVHEAIERVLETYQESGYLPTIGDSQFTQQVQNLLFGSESDAVKENRIATVQTIGGSNALRLMSDFLHKHFPELKVYISTPTWGDHQYIFQSAGFEVDRYPYYNLETKSLDFESLCETLKSHKDFSAFVFQASCHNPTAEDLTPEQWDTVISIMKNSLIIPIIDIPYQGLGDGLEQDSYVIRKMAEKGLSFIVASSCCKNFSLYEERVGALSFITGDETQAANVLSQLKTNIRANFSSPTAFGSRIVTTILSDEALRERWVSEVDQMRNHCNNKRQALVEALSDAGLEEVFPGVADQKGIFAFFGLSKEQVVRLRKDYGVYLVGNGRLCLTSLPDDRMRYVVEALAKVSDEPQ